ncbi:CaiB/BaiF CoA transferase family protein [Gulosibacter molinativorax]|uniref:CaiB/BaiF CoA transferase family protein n=1 Tax=Gulosibacter molinativorax TaxID=256821 RepID=UPI00040E631F|nr:CaiB/BaiF CoA-transferase family protein [Gulosibacter molinativorax]QUY63717.1 Acetyl-CoA:oxalate CoA-transferase [Gulosibacter molinativorax]
MSETQSRPGPLSNIRVLDLSRVLAGPLTSMNLADLGADVIKVERPGAGDDTRQWGPPFAEDGTATYFQTANRNKRSIAIDFREPAGLQLILDLIAESDVVVENYLPGALERAGIDLEAIRKEQPSLIVASITGFGSAGGASRPGYDFVAQALSGLMHVTGERDGEAMKVGVALVDVLASKDSTIGILAALQHRDRTGEGMRVEVNLLSSIQAALANQIQATVGAGVEPTRLGNVHPSIMPYESLPASDGEIAVAIGNNKQFRDFVTLLGRPELADDERFATNPDRVAHRPELREILSEALASDTAENWQERCVAANLAVGKVNTIGEGIELAQELGIDPVLELERDGVASKGIRHPVRYTPAFDMPTAGPPALDADGDAIRDRV